MSYLNKLTDKNLFYGYEANLKNFGRCELVNSAGNIKGKQ